MIDLVITHALAHGKVRLVLAVGTLRIPLIVIRYDHTRDEITLRLAPHVTRNKS